MSEFGKNAAKEVQDSAKTSAVEANQKLYDEFARAAGDKSINPTAFRSEMEQGLNDVLPSLSIVAFESQKFVEKYDKNGDGAVSDKELKDAAASKDTPQADKLMIKQLAAQYEALKAQSKTDAKDGKSNADGITNADVAEYLRRNDKSKPVAANDAVVMDYGAFKQTMKDGKVVDVEFPGKAHFVFENGKWVAKDGDKTVDCKVERKPDGTFVVESEGKRQEHRPDGTVVEMKVEKWGAQGRERDFIDPKADGSAKYEVKSGDTLWEIARDVVRKRTGNANPSNAEVQKQVDEIHAANKDKLNDPDRIYPGQELTIPPEKKKEDTSDSSKETKTETVLADGTKRTVERDGDKVTVTEEKDGKKTTYQKIGDKVYKSVDNGPATEVPGATVDVSADNKTVTIKEGNFTRTTYPNGTTRTEENGKTTIKSKGTDGNAVEYVQENGKWKKNGQDFEGTIEVKADGSVAETPTNPNQTGNTDNTANTNNTNNTDNTATQANQASKPIGYEEAAKEAAVLKRYFGEIATQDGRKDGYENYITPDEIDKFIAAHPELPPEEKAVLLRAKQHLGRIQGVSNDETGWENDGATMSDIVGFAEREKNFEEKFQAKAYLEENFDAISRGNHYITAFDIDVYRAKRVKEGATPEELKKIDAAKKIVIEQNNPTKAGLKTMTVKVGEERYDLYDDNSSINKP